MSTLLANTMGNWKHRISALLWALFLYQYIHWLSQQEYNGMYWLDPTIKAVHVSFIISVLIEAIFRFRRIYMLLVHGILVLAAQLWILEFELQWMSIRSVHDFMMFIQINMKPLLPYIWFGFGAAFMFLLISRWANSKLRIAFFIVISIILFAIIDSFSTSLYLWDQVAYMVFSGLLLLTLQHFSQFKKDFPSSWEYLKEYPGTIAAPVLILIAVIVLAGTLAPNRPPILTDPYTAWRSWKGETVQSFGKPFEGLPAFTRNTRTESGYSRHDSVLGGGFNYDYSPVLKVYTTHRSYWRGEVRSYYNGQGWEPGELEVNASTVAVLPGLELSAEDRALDTSKLQTEEVRQSITVVGESSYPVLFGAFAINQFDSLIDDAYTAVRWSPAQQELRWNEGTLEYPKSYQIVSNVPVIDPKLMRLASTEMPPELALQYTQLPVSVTQRVKDLAAEVTADGDNAFDKVKLLEQYLKTEFPYTNRPDLSKAGGEDFVDNFLFEIQEGYCDYYSTAMVVMARSLGIPARWVKGYAAGVYEMESFPGFAGEHWDQIDPQGSGTYTVRNADAHSWVEVYFKGYGWIPFEPTANFSLPTIQIAEAAAPFDPLPSPSEVEEAQTITEDSNRSAIVAIIAAAVVAAGVIQVAVKKKWLSGFPISVPWRRRNRLEAKQQIIHDFERFLRFAKRKGFTRKEHETAREAFVRWNNSLLRDDLHQLLAIFEKAKYSSQAIQPKDVHATQQLIEKLSSQLK